nr:MAG TPA: hypothetical protein [Caudoviricetes sp.]
MPIKSAPHLFVLLFSQNSQSLYCICEFCEL